MNRKIPFVIELLCAVLVLAACSTTFESKKIAYKSAGKLPPLEVPPDLTAPTRDERYSVPDINPKSTATYSSYSAERSGQVQTSTGPDVLPTVDKVRVEREGSHRWLVVKEAPDKLWPEIKNFWQELGFIINLDSPDAGIMETDWAENRAKIPQDFIRNAIGKVLDSVYSTAERDKFRTRLEPGKGAGTTEVYISHRGVQEVFTSDAKDNTVWQPRPSDPELEAEMLRRLTVRLGADDKRAATQIAAEQKDERAKLQTAAEGAGSLQLLESFDRAWRRVGLALDRVGFTVEDRDRSKGSYYVRYVDPEADAKSTKDKGWLSKLAFWRSNDTTKALTKVQYRIQVKDEGANSSVQVQTAEGGLDRSETAKKILGLLYDQLK